MFFQIYRKEVVFLFQNQKYVVGAQNSRLIEVVLLIIQNNTNDYDHTVNCE